MNSDGMVYEHNRRDFVAPTTGVLLLLENGVKFQKLFGLSHMLQLTVCTREIGAR